MTTPTIAVLEFLGKAIEHPSAPAGDEFKATIKKGIRDILDMKRQLDESNEDNTMLNGAVKALKLVIAIMETERKSASPEMDDFLPTMEACNISLLKFMEEIQVLILASTKYAEGTQSKRLLDRIEATQATQHKALTEWEKALSACAKLVRKETEVMREYRKEVATSQKAKQQVQAELANLNRQAEIAQKDAEELEARRVATIAALEKQISTLKGSVTELTEKARYLGSDNDELRRQLAGRQAAKETAPVEIHALKARLDKASDQELALRAEIKNSQTKIEHLQTENKGLQTCCFDLIRVYTFWHKERSAEDTESVSDDDNDPHLVMDW